MANKRVTIRDVAEKAGVSASAVSLALRNDHRISEATRKNIMKVVEELGYRPNPMVSALMSQVQKKSVKNDAKLAMISPFGSHEILNKSPFNYGRAVIGAMETRAEELGYGGIDLFEPETDVRDLSQLARVISYRGIRGVLLPPFFGDHVYNQFKIDFSDFAIVAAGYSQKIDGIHRIAHDQYKITFQIVQKAIEKGYRRIGLTLSDEFERRTGWHYTGGFYGAIHPNKKVWNSPKAIFIRETAEPERLEEALIHWVKKNRLECVITQVATDYQCLKDAGFKIPDDIGFALLTVQEEKHRPIKDVSGMFHDPIELGRAAVDLVTAQIARNEFGIPPFPKTVLTRPKWIEGETL